MANEAAQARKRSLARQIKPVLRPNWRGRLAAAALGAFAAAQANKAAAPCSHVDGAGRALLAADVAAHHACGAVALRRGAGGTAVCLDGLSLFDGWH